MGGIDGLRLRPFTEDDVDWWVALRQQADDTVGAETLTRVVTGAVRFDRHTVAELDGVRVGAGSLSRPPVEDRQTFLVTVDRDHRGRGIGSALFADCRSAIDPVLPVTAFMSDHERHSLDVVQHWGFEVTSHGILSRLSALPEVPPEPRPGIVLEVVDDALGATPEQDAMLAELMDVSDTSPERLELGWESTPDDHRRFFPAMLWVVAVVDGIPAAMTSGGPGDDDEWLVVYSGTRPEHRRRGLARYVKEALHVEARRRGATAVATMNEERNAAVRGLNADLGYQVVGGEYRLRMRSPSV